eukprot:7491236-Lingulodinium_polyedra.AAC.1
MHNLQHDRCALGARTRVRGRPHMFTFRAVYTTDARRRVDRPQHKRGLANARPHAPDAINV